MNVLLTNDDGIYADGIWALYKCFAGQHIVTVVAPDRERSAVGHGITLDDPLRASLVELKGGYRGYAVSGTPADCIKLAILEILDTKPDVVISGINPGANVGINLNYSGTVAAAKEAALYGMAAIAVSMKAPDATDYDAAAAFIKNLTEKVMENGLPSGTFLNVNLPSAAIEKSAGVRLSKQGLELYGEYFDKRTDPRNRTYYWQGFELPYFDEKLDSDGTVLNKNFISITPIKCDMTDYRVLEDLKKWEIDI